MPVITLVIEGVTLPLLAFAPELGIALIILYFNSFIGGFADPPMINLTFEQVPEFRGTIMSINVAFVFHGTTIGAGIGGFVLAIFGYTGIFLACGLLLLVTAAIIFFLTVDPCLSITHESIKSISS